MYTNQLSDNFNGCHKLVDSFSILFPYRDMFNEMILTFSKFLIEIYMVYPELLDDSISHDKVSNLRKD